MRILVIDGEAAESDQASLATSAVQTKQEDRESSPTGEILLPADAVAELLAVGLT